jgi:addiction module HigA family antidote
MIEQSNNAYKPDSVSAPGDTLADILDERGLSQAELAERCGRPLKTINEIVKGKAAITPETALQLERVLGTPADFWNQREANYRAYLARRKETTHLSSQKEWLAHFPLKEMKKRGWIQNVDGQVTDQIISVLNFFGVATPEDWKAGWTHRRLAFRKAMNIDTDMGATAVWLRQGEIEGERIQCKTFNKDSLLAALPRIRELTLQTDPKVFIPKLQQICADCGVAVVFVQGFPKVAAFGASSWLNPEKALVILSVRGKLSDQLWFTIFHELGHILKHSKKEMFVELKGADKSGEEVEADEFAANALIPEHSLQTWLKNNPILTVPSIKSFANKEGIAVGILVGRLQHLGKLTWSSHLINLK